ncbi:hypothetical protein [Halarchaeum sp. P4]|uniref:hypothetical protein n=1 Tax=Halarchaeum sp. P4 TaxID=3421639 RepID=UPI003EBA4361
MHAPVRRTALRLHDRVGPVGRRLATACLATGYAGFALAVVAPDLLDAVRGVTPGGTVNAVAYLVTFAYPSTYALLALVAAAGAVTVRGAGSAWSRRDRVHVYLAVAFAEWDVHHLLYIAAPLTLFWALVSPLLGPAYAIPVWAMLCVDVVGILVGNRYMWYHDPGDLPPGAHGDGAD